MSIDFESNETMVRTPSSWEQNNISAEFYKSFMSRFEQEFIITKQIEIGGGLSGARTSSVRIEPRRTSNSNVKVGQYILKVCLAEDAKQEIAKHRAAKENPILSGCVPEIIALRSYEETPLTGILYQIAGGNQLTQTTLQKSLEEDHFPISQIEELAKTVLRWNFEGLPLNWTSDLLESIQKSLERLEMHRLQSLADRLGGIVEDIHESVIDLGPLKTILQYNPVHFLLNMNVYQNLRQIGPIIPLGILHGDLHPANVIIPTSDHPEGGFHIIDFAASGTSNAFFDLAYLEISILLNSPSGFHGMKDLKHWWKLEEYLHSKPLPTENGFTGIREGLQLALPLRRALYQRMQQDSSEGDYWVAYLAASVEAGLDLARKTYRDRSIQRVAFLTSVSRFHQLIELLKAVDTPPKGRTNMYWPGEEPPSAVLPSTRQQAREDSGNTPALPGTSVVGETKQSRIELAWPGEITRRTALYDPWNMVERIWGDLTGDNDQAVLLIGERKFGKTSFFNSVGGLFKTSGGNRLSVRLDILNVHPLTVQFFANQLLSKMCRRVGLLRSPVPYSNPDGAFDADTFLAACQSVVERNPDARFVICIDEIDSAINNARTIEEGWIIQDLLSRLLTDPDMPVRLLLTASDTKVLRRSPGGIDFLSNLGIETIPLCSEPQMRDLIELFDVPVVFQEDALHRIYEYSGGQIYFVKLAVNACKAQLSNRDGKRIIDAQLVDKLMQEVIEPLSSTSFEIRNLHEAVFLTMKNIYEKHFSPDERRFMKSLTEAAGKLRTSSFEVSKEQLATTANALYRRMYLSKTETDEDEIYSWRIGLWQLFLNYRYDIRQHTSQEI
jgi:hypothetical protein